jgi:hypothetical protein
LEVPAVTPELAYRTLRTALAEEQCGILLVLVKVGRIDDPYEHILVVGGFYPTGLYLAALYLVVDMLVFGSELGELVSLGGVEGIDFVGLLHRVSLAEDLVAHEGDAAKVVLA